MPNGTISIDKIGERWPRLLALTLVAMLAAGCGANETILKSGRESPPPANAAPSLPTFEKDLDDMSTADFAFIYVLRRKDGGPIDADDRSVIKLHTAEANRRVSSDNGKAVIIGGHAQILPAKMAALYDRFVIENYSKPDAVNNAAAANVN